jgi:2-dehydro-3-deoxygalactonokinase
MAPDTAFIAIDWGSSSFRAWALSATGTVLAEARSDQGLKSVADRGFEAVVAANCGPWLRSGRRIPVVLSGMVGSRTGWVEADYVACPADPAGLSGGATRFEIAGHPAAILPGVLCHTPEGHADVMRGEEVQILGGGRLTEIGDALVCIPGTHSKWARLEGGALTWFRTFVTGELYALLRHRSLVGALAEGERFDRDAFGRGLGYGARTPLAHAVFSARADALTGGLAAEAVASYLSGLLLGAELAGRPEAGGAEVVLMASGVLAERYEAALGLVGLPYRVLDAEQATIAGLALAARELWPELGSGRS